MKLQVWRWFTPEAAVSRKIRQAMLKRPTAFALYRDQVGSLPNLPASIGELRWLSELELSHNQFEKLPESLGNLKELQSLACADNILISLPWSIGRLTRLRVLNLGTNHIADLPASFGRLTKLESLYLGDNRLVNLPDSFQQLTNLKELYLTANRLTSLPEGIGNLVNLRSLFLAYNELASLPESIRNLNGLKNLFLHGNPSLNIPMEVLGPTIEELHGGSQETGRPSLILDYYFGREHQKKSVALNQPDLRKIVTTVALGENVRKAVGESGEQKAIRAQAFGGLRVFISYSHKDEKLREELDDHLQTLRRTGLVQWWHDRNILPGEDWKKQIDDNLEAADVVILLISVAFIRSDYCYENEMQRALARHAEGKVRVVPIICRACTWHETPFGRLQVLPQDGVPISQYQDRDAAWTEVVVGLRKVIDEVRVLRGLSVN